MSVATWVDTIRITSKTAFTGKMAREKTHKERALQIIRRHQGSAPIDLVRIANGLGVAIYLDDTLPDDVSGVLNRDGKGHFILVNRNHHINRQRFTLAHELAHFVLHRDKIGDGIEDTALYRSRLSNKQEWEANKLAADILMPWYLVEQFSKEHNNPPLKDYAKKFRVSKSAMAIRLGIPLGDT